MGTAAHPNPNSPYNDPETREILRALPPSAKLVAKVLDHTSPLTLRELADHTLLPDRTVRYAINRLENAGLIQSRYSHTDARKQLYFFE